ncbi:MAG TPA: acetyl-CoA hydrolase/transferase C-terminal domain-containing protein [Streptosporangiaceae bacterium]|nr:acetyl-CoA hydrolase/transferase C-terminal domain-containing protein [Streptosporangiaceae bacterium]
MLTVTGMFAPLPRELRETRYQFTEDFVMDSSAAQGTFGIRPTPWDRVLERSSAPTDGQAQAEATGKMNGKQNGPEPARRGGMGTAELKDLVRPGMTVAVGDGFGAPRSASRELSEAAARAGGVRLILGWVPLPDPGLDFGAFADVRTYMPGWGLRAGTDAGLVSFPPVRLSAVPALLHGHWRPDLLVATVVQVSGGFAFGTEVSWQRAAIAAGATVAAVISHRAPHADAGNPLPARRVVVVGESHEPPGAMPEVSPGPAHRAIATLAAPLITESARLQVGPSPVATALLDELRLPVRIDSGLLPDAVVDLDERGLLLGEPVTAYLAGGPRLYGWADGRPLLHPIEYTHDLGRLSADPLFAVNTAVEIDLDGQVNVEGTATSVLGGIGGHPDYAAAGARSVGGLSIIAVVSEHNGRPTLVSRLSRPVSTPGHDVDVVVTDRGVADLRGLSRPERRQALSRLWDGQIAPGEK